MYFSRCELFLKGGQYNKELVPDYKSTHYPASFKESVFIVKTKQKQQKIKKPL